MKEILGVIIFAMVGMTLFCLMFMFVDMWLGCVFSSYLEGKIRKLLEQEDEDDDRNSL